MPTAITLLFSEKKFLSSRDEIRKIKRKINPWLKKNGTSIILDFSQVEFFSGGFTDELLKLEENGMGKIILRLKGSPLKMHRAVKERRKKRI